MGTRRPHRTAGTRRRAFWARSAAERRSNDPGGLAADPSSWPTWTPASRSSRKTRRRSSCGTATARCCAGARTVPGRRSTSIFWSRIGPAGRNTSVIISSIRMTTNGGSISPITARCRADCARKNVFFTPGVTAAFDAMNELCGHENVLTGMAMDPDWVRDMCDVYATVTVDTLEILFAREGLPDGLWVWDDLGFKQRPFMSPAMYREMIFPAHKRVFDFAHRHGLPAILAHRRFDRIAGSAVDRGGRRLPPTAGSQGRHGPSEDQEALRRPDRADRRNGRPDADLERSRASAERSWRANCPQAMAGSGYVLQVDHSVSHEVNYETYKYFVEKGLEIGTYA